MNNKPFQPSNGSHFEAFYSVFCARCRKDAAHRADSEGDAGCEILARALAYGIQHKRYPTEWVIDEGHHGEIGGKTGARCTAFEDETKEPPAYRCPLTPDLFA